MNAPPIPDDGYVYVFMHLEKTGGTTINAHLAEHLGFDERFVHLGPWGNQARAGLGTPQPDEWPDRRLRRLRAISGHRVHATVDRLVPAKTARFFTFLRDPARLAVSQYNHDSSRLERPAPFEEWYAARRPNPQLGWLEHRLGCLGHDEVIERLERFWFVGTTEELDVDLPHIFTAIGVPPAFTRRRQTAGGRDLEGVWPPIEDVPVRRLQELTGEIEARVLADDRVDRNLHRWAGRRAAELRTRYGWA